MKRTKTTDAIARAVGSHKLTESASDLGLDPRALEFYVAVSDDDEGMFYKERRQLRATCSAAAPCYALTLKRGELLCARHASVFRRLLEEVAATGRSPQEIVGVRPELDPRI